ncbi:hypothetical protein ACL07V_32495 [Streptomyces sp. MB22_4]|uniref:hypothetical protein n=1 Tax=Streptomyces sp. MB22_4 TaxID=3383120 RepID=UPI0039A179C8
MPLPVHALAHRPLTTEAVAELVALPFVAPVGEDHDAVDEELRRRGWDREDLVRESFRTGHGHVLRSDDDSPFGELEARTFLLPPADDGQALADWITAHIDW